MERVEVGGIVAWQRLAEGRGWSASILVWRPGAACGGAVCSKERGNAAEWLGHLGTAGWAGERIIFLSMRTKWQFSAFVVGAVLVCGPALGWGQSSYPSQDSGAKQDMKDAGHESKDAAKDAGHGVKRGTKKAYHKTKHETKKAWHKTKDTTEGAVNGAKEGAKKPE